MTSSEAHVERNAHSCKLQSKVCEAEKCRVFCFCVFVICENSILPILLFSFFDLVIAAPLPRGGSDGIS